MKKIFTVLCLIVGTLSAAYASEEVSLTALVNNNTLIFNRHLSKIIPLFISS